MDIQALMKRDPQVTRLDSTLKEAAQMMAEVDCGALPVVQSEGSRRPVGIVTDRDIVVRCIAEGLDPEAATVRDAYTKDTVCCDEDCSAREAFEMMRREKVGRLMVTDSGGDLIGIVTMADIIARVPGEILNQLPGAHKPKPRIAA